MQSVADKEVASTIQILASRWAGAGALLPAFPLLARGQPLEIEEIASASRRSVDRVARAVNAARCERDHAGRLIDLYGLTLTPTLHRLSINGRILFTCCALWAHAIPKLVKQTIDIESVDPITRELIRLSVSPEGVRSAQPAGAMATVAVAGQNEVDADVSAAFCSHTRHFVSRESAERFAAQSSVRRTLSQEMLERLANELVRGIGRTSREGVVGQAHSA